MRTPTRALFLATAACLLTACQPTTQPTAGQTTDNPSVGISTHAVVTSGGGTPPTATAPTTPTGPLLKVSGNGIKNTKRFTTGDNWTINYTYDCAGTYGGQGNFQVYVDYPGGDVPVNELGAKGASSSTATGAGVHSLKVVSECSWTVTVTDG